MDQAHLVEAMDAVMRRLSGGTTRHWRTDRLATVIRPGTGRRPSSSSRRYADPDALAPGERPVWPTVGELADVHPGLGGGELVVRHRLGTATLDDMDCGEGDSPSPQTQEP
ncbi:MAG: hypothetical protein NVS3B12_14280 [Acidimicrobiales bacterium]